MQLEFYEAFIGIKIKIKWKEEKVVDTKITNIKDTNHKTVQLRN